MSADDPGTTTITEPQAVDTPAVDEPDSGGDQQPQEAQEGTSRAGQRSLEDLLGDLDEDSRKTVLRQVRKARTEAANLRARLNEAAPKATEYEQLLEQRKTAEQKAVERADAAEQKAQAATERLVAAEVRAQAAAEFADPNDATAFLDLPSLVDDQGEVDIDAIADALADLLERKPHLRKTGTPRRPAPDPSQGSSAGGSSTTPEEAFASFLQAQLRAG